MFKPYYESYNSNLILNFSLDLVGFTLDLVKLILFLDLGF